MPQSVEMIKYIVQSTFNSPNLPTSIKSAYLSCPVWPYNSNFIRCFKCQNYGHGKKILFVVPLPALQKLATTIKTAKMLDGVPAVKIITQHIPVLAQIGSEKKIF